jgi:hypothetical protein
MPQSFAEEAYNITCKYVTFSLSKSIIHAMKLLQNNLKNNRGRKCMELFWQAAKNIQNMQQNMLVEIHFILFPKSDYTIYS